MRNKIVLIDDNEKPREELNEALKAVIANMAGTDIVEVWQAETIKQSLSDNESTDGLSNAMEDVFGRVFAAESELKLVVVDHDLSGFNLAISKSAVVAGCRKARIPVCTYHRGPTPSTDAANLRFIQDQQHSFSIQVSFVDAHEAAKDIWNIALGFDEIYKGVSSHLQEGLSGGPAEIIAKITEHPDQSSYFLQYLESPALFSDILGFSEEAVQDDLEILARKLSLVLGYWLHNYVLVFPGILLNRVAAASYLDLDIPSFESNAETFSVAKYEGPFAAPVDYWWRYDLEDMLINADVESGYDLLRAEGVATNMCKCSISGESPAGYYCIASQKPISMERSKGNIVWMPSGADLCRINNDTFDKLSPLLEM